MSSVLGNAASGWYIDYGNGMEDTQVADYIWASHVVDDPESAVSARGLNVGASLVGTPCSKKRNRVESSAEPGTKACREKMRRDRLNDRFSELSILLEPGKPPRADKAAVLVDATRRISHLRLEAQTLKETNESLQDTIKSLKAEKADLREEKMRLKAEKERLEQVLKGMSAPTPTPFMPLPAAVTGPYCHPTATFVTYGENKRPANYKPAQMWQWIPPAALDTSQDHVLRPPVA